MKGEQRFSNWADLFELPRRALGTWVLECRGLSVGVRDLFYLIESVTSTSEYQEGIISFT